MQHGINIDYAGLSPAIKLQIIKEMGFGEISPGEHSSNCTSLWGRGLICDCLPGVTTWGAPFDMKHWLGETQEQRVAFAELRLAYDPNSDTPGVDPSPWYKHLERTAPRYNT